MSSSSGREVELKLRVDDLAALMKIAIASGGTPEPTALQTNAYYDTPDRALGARGLVMRVRREAVRDRARTFVTAKGPGQRSGNLTSVLEEEVEVDDVESAERDPIAALQKPPTSESRRALIGAIVSTLGSRALVKVGAFHNERTRIAVDLGFHAVLELDRTMFPGDQVHHEVEMEVPDGVDPDVASRALDDLFRKAGVKGRVSTGKARRFFAALRGERLD
jgi:uncharacterized protein YjbK